MRIPGKILIVDDTPEDVKELLKEFTELGEHALYSGLIVNPEYYKNIRLLIMDYWIHDTDEKNSLETIATIVEEAFKESKIFMVVIWSVKTTDSNFEEYTDKVKSVVKKRLQTEDAPIIILDVLSKNDLDAKKLIEKISQEIPNHPELQFLYEIEKIVDQAKDSVTNKIYDLGSWSTLVKNLKKEYDQKSIENQILCVYLNFLKNNLFASTEFTQCLETLLKKEENPFNINDFARLYSAQNYFEVDDDSQIGNGDVLYDKESKVYCLVTTPECDIAQNKYTALKLIESERIEQEHLMDKASLQQMAKKYNLVNEGKFFGPTGTLKAVLFNQGMSGNYCTIPFLKDQKSNFYHLIFDFHKVKNIKKIRSLSELPNYQRVCRLNTPLMNDFVRKYASHCLRFGIMSLPRDEIKAKLTEIIQQKENKANGK